MSVTATAEQAHVFQMSDHLSADIPVAGTRAGAPSTSQAGMFAEEQPSFWDVLDVINPLQHIPVVNTLYREMTGDKIGVGAQVVGGTLFGGPIGLAASLINLGVQESTGQDIGGHVLAMFRDEPPVAAPATQVATDAPPPPVATQAAEPPQPAAAPQAAVQSFALEPPAASMPAAPTMWFQADAPAGLATAAKADGGPVPLTQPAAPARFMPLPPRGAAVVGSNVPPPVSVPISNSGTRSNVPITGRDPVASGPAGLAAQRLVAEEKANAAGAPAQDWFSSAMMTGLDKYEQAAKLGRPAPSAPIPLQ